MSRPTLVIFVKEPRPGRVKTRLARDVGTVRAAWWFRHQAGGLARRLGCDPRWRTVLAVSPDHEGMSSRVWKGTLPRWPQGGGHLGRRILGAVKAMPPGPVMIVGADIPGITRAHIARALGALCRSEAVIGPSPDGGYWLIGFRRGGSALPLHLLDSVRWSTTAARADTMACLAPRKIAITDELADVDGLADLRRLGLPLV